MRGPGLPRGSRETRTGLKGMECITAAPCVLAYPGRPRRNPFSIHTLSNIGRMTSLPSFHDHPFGRSARPTFAQNDMCGWHSWHARVSSGHAVYAALPAHEQRVRPLERELHHVLLPNAGAWESRATSERMPHSYSTSAASLHIVCQMSGRRRSRAALGPACAGQSRRRGGRRGVCTGRRVKRLTGLAPHRLHLLRCT